MLQYLCNQGRHQSRRSRDHQSASNSSPQNIPPLPEELFYNVAEYHICMVTMQHIIRNHPPFSDSTPPPPLCFSPSSISYTSSPSSLPAQVTCLSTAQLHCLVRWFLATSWNVCRVRLGPRLSTRDTPLGRTHFTCFDITCTRTAATDEYIALTTSYVL